MAVTVHHIDHVGIVVNDLAAAKAFFLDLGLQLSGEGELEGGWLDTIVGLKDVKTAYAFLRMPHGQTSIELVHFYRPAVETESQPLPANTPGIRHIALVVEDIDAVVARLKQTGTPLFSEVQTYEASYKLCYVRGPEGIILELAQPIQ